MFLGLKNIYYNNDRDRSPIDQESIHFVSNISRSMTITILSIRFKLFILKI